MDISLLDVIPQPLADSYNPKSEIWGTPLQIPSGSYTEVVSASGKGKSTLLNILYGIRKDYTGSCTLGDKDVRSYSLTELAELRRSQLSIIFQDLRLFPQLTGWENLQAKNRLTGHCTDQQIRDMCHRLEVTALLDKPCGIMSYGQQQRIAIIRALCQPFQLLMLDEPFSHLDTANVERCCTLIAETCQSQGAGLLLATLGEHYPLPFTHQLTI